MRSNSCQIEYIGEDIKEKLFLILEKENVIRPFFVVGTAFRCLSLMDVIKKQYPQSVFFDKFLPNPSYESIVVGIKLFRNYNCDFIVAVGGGSAIDVAKSIKAFAFIDEPKCYLNYSIEENGIKIVAVPTTAGTGSEATQFGVIYYKGVKQSVSHESLLPDYVILDANTLKYLPIYQKKVTMLDALCHGIESLWSINSTETSRQYASIAIKNILYYKDIYLSNKEENNLKMLCAANYSGKAINITKTTVAHAMSYKMTSIYGISHGHSVGLCLPRVWEYMINHMDLCVETRGKDFLNTIFKHISNLLGYTKPVEAIAYLDKLMLEDLQLEKPKSRNGEIRELVEAVNVERLKNSPVYFSEDALNEIYTNILM